MDCKVSNKKFLWLFLRFLNQYPGKVRILRRMKKYLKSFYNALEYAAEFSFNRLDLVIEFPVRFHLGAYVDVLESGELLQLY